MGATVLDRDQAAPNGETPGRRIDRRVPLPGGRAVVGGLLIALAAIGVFTAWTAATEEGTRPFVVVAGDVRPGEVLAPSDLEIRGLDLPADVADRAYADPADLVGAVALAPLGEGELVQRSAVRKGGGAGGATSELSFAIDADRAVDGGLQVGERVDVLATFGTGEDATTEVVVRGAQVLAATRDDSGIGSHKLVLTLALDDGDEVLALTHAVRAGEVTVVRTTGTTGTGSG